MSHVSIGAVGLFQMKERFVNGFWAIAFMPLALVLFPGVAGAQLTINGAQTYQTIDGFGANINHRSWNGDELKPVVLELG